jgi:hypothetical protein
VHSWTSVLAARETAQRVERASGWKDPLACLANLLAAAAVIVAQVLTMISYLYVPVVLVPSLRIEFVPAWEMYVVNVHPLATLVAVRKILWGCGHLYALAFLALAFVFCLLLLAPLGVGSAIRWRAVASEVKCMAVFIDLQSCRDANFQALVWGPRDSSHSLRVVVELHLHKASWSSGSVNPQGDAVSWRWKGKRFCVIAVLYKQLFLPRKCQNLLLYIHTVHHTTLSRVFLSSVRG